MNVFIAGGGGYIGSRLVSHLKKKDYGITVLDLFWFGNYLPPDTTVFQKDLFELTPDDLRGYDAVIFLAGLSNDPMAEYSPALNFIHNAAGPAHLAYVAKEAGVPRFIYAGSCSVYGYAGSEQTSNEDDPAKSVYPYGISKLQGELAVRELDDENFSVICFRQGTVCGWSPRMRFDLVVNAMYKSAITEGVVRVDNPDIWRPILAITDAVVAYEQALLADRSVRGVFNISSGNFTIGEIGRHIAERLAESYRVPVRVETSAKPSLRNYRVSTAKAAEELKLVCTGTIESIVDDIHEHIGIQLADAENERYYNVRTFKRLLGNGHFTKFI
jgi:nucleoside-diphosphate-sugar epimerase